MIDGSDIICSVGFHMRYSPSVDRFRELMEGRTVNFVQSILAGSSVATRSLDDWFFLKEKSGGHIMDQAIHSIDLMRLVVGEISQVQTFGNNVVCPKTNDFTIEVRHVLIFGLPEVLRDLTFIHGQPNEA